MQKLITTDIKNPLITVVIVTWNSEKDIEACLESIINQDYKNIKIIVVDNNSSDKTATIVKDRFPLVTLLPQTKNLFLTGGNNLGISYAIKEFSSEYVMVLNPDTKASSNLVSTLIEALQVDTNYGAAGPKVKFWNNSNEGLINSAGLKYDGFIQAYDIGFMEEDKGQYNQRKEVFGVTGACILYRTSMLQQIGLYWNEIKMYLDEVEMFIRAHKYKWKVIYVPETILLHNFMQSTNKNKNFNRQKQVMKAWLLIAIRHYSLKSKLAMLLKYLKFLLHIK